MFIWKEHPVIIQNEFYDSKEKFFKRFTALELKLIEGKWTITQMKMERIDGTHETLFLWTDVKYNVGLSKESFNYNKLGRF